jgi:hypothetical protein
MKHDGTSDGELFHYSCMVWIIQTNLDPVGQCKKKKKKKKKKKNKQKKKKKKKKINNRY